MMTAVNLSPMVVIWMKPDWDFPEKDGGELVNHLTYENGEEAKHISP